MKNKRFLLVLFTILSFMFLVACGGEDDPVKNEKAEITTGETELEINVGETKQIEFEVKNAGYEVQFSGFNDELIEVDSDGVVKAIAEGETTISVSIVADDEDATSKSYSVKVVCVEQRKVNVKYEFDVEGTPKSGSVPASKDIKYGTSITLDAAPEYEGYEFLGYSLTKNGTEFVTKLDNVKSNVTVYAVYKKIVKPVVSYVVDGEEIEGETKTLNVGDKVNPTLVIVDKTGFLGWVSSVDLPEIITGEVEITKDTVFTAVFSKTSYNISYDLNGGDWEKTYYTVDEFATKYVSDYNANGGSAKDATYLDTAHLDSSTFAAAYSKKAMKDKWMWLYKALCEQAKRMDDMNPETVDLTSYGAKSFYISEICGFLTKTQHKDSNFGTTSVDYSQIENQMAIINKSPAKSEVTGATSYKPNNTIKLVTPVRTGYEFAGWSINGVTIDSFKKTFVGDVKLVAEWEQATLPSEINFSNLPADGIKLYESLQLKWTVGPTDAYNKDVYFQALDPSILTITEKGLVNTISKGTGRIKIKFAANSAFESTIEIAVTSGDYFDISYETVSYTTVGNSIKLNSKYYDLQGNAHDVTWESLTPTIATVDNSGNVTAIATGLASIRSKYDDTHYIDFTVTVLENDLSEELQFILNNHNSNALTVYNLGIGDGNPAYYYDVVGSVNNILFNPLKIDRTYYDKLPSGTKNYGEMTSVEFICVHYTGNMANGADADNNCDYFNNLGYEASIHFVTGRSNLYGGYSEEQYYAFAGLNEKYAGWHASTGRNAVVWDKTGIKVAEGDPEVPVVSISDNNKFTVNGKESTISIPAIPDGYNVKGNVLTYGGATYTAINQMGLRASVIGDEYYIARTYWGSQRSPKAICTYGGNTNSIGIESCVDIGSDLMHTWHVTAQLVAKLLLDNNLGFDRVVGHHFFSGKDCPQPMLENDGQLWEEFMEMVKAEYALLTTYKDVKVTAKGINKANILSDKGLLKQDAQSHVVTYEVTVEKNGVKKTITLATAVESYYCFDGTRQVLSLQNTGYTIK